MVPVIPAVIPLTSLLLTSGFLPRGRGQAACQLHLGRSLGSRDNQLCASLITTWLQPGIVLGEQWGLSVQEAVKPEVLSGDPSEISQVCYTKKRSSFTQYFTRLLHYIFFRDTRFYGFLRLSKKELLSGKVFIFILSPISSRSLTSGCLNLFPKTNCSLPSSYYVLRKDK